MKKANRTLSFVLPALNEEENVGRAAAELKRRSIELGYDYEIIFVDDGSTDGTLRKLRDLHNGDPKIHFVCLSKNMGEQRALKAGLDHASGDAVITMDADLQHPPSYLGQMLEKWEQGTQIVIMKRASSGRTNVFITAMEILFYRLLILISKSNVHYRFSGFCLIDQKPLKVIQQYNESDPFLRAIIGDIGFDKCEIEYEEQSRQHGRSNYSFLKLVRVALDGLTSYSTVPLFLSFYMGLTAVALAGLYVVYALFNFSRYGAKVEGWMSTMTIMVFLGGVQLISTGILGLYVGKSFIYLKGRPTYIINESTKHRM